MKLVLSERRNGSWRNLAIFPANWTKAVHSLCSTWDFGGKEISLGIDNNSSKESMSEKSFEIGAVCATFSTRRNRLKMIHSGSKRNIPLQKHPEASRSQLAWIVFWSLESTGFILLLGALLNYLLHCSSSNCHTVSHNIAIHVTSLPFPPCRPAGRSILILVHCRTEIRIRI